LSEGELRQTQKNPTQGSAFLRATIPTGTHYDYEVDSAQLALFAQTQWQVSEAWDVIVGARLESQRYKYDNRGLDGRTRDDGAECGFGGCRYSRPADREDRFTHFSPKLEIRYSPTEQWRFSVSAADSFRAPQATELYRLQRAQTVADLDIVEAKSLEASARYSKDNLQWTALMYWLDIDNVIIRDSNFFNIDGQRTHSRGIELSVHRSLNERLGWRLIASVADHEYASDRVLNDGNINGNQVDTAPNVFGSLFVNWQTNQELEFEAEVQHMGRYYLEPGNAHDYPGHTLLHMRASYAVSDHWNLRLRLLNVTDKRYAERADFTGFTGARYFPGEPRSVFAELEYTF